MKERKCKVMAKRVIKGIGLLVLAVAVLLGCYVAYLELTYDRIADNQALTVENNAEAVLKTDVAYTAISYNVGFGAYTPDYTFFMDDGTLKDGTAIRGSSATCVSRESAVAAISGSAQLVRSLNPDFALLQEVDRNSDRSYLIDQADYFATAMAPAGSAYAVNAHSAFLAVLPTDMIGCMRSGLQTCSKYQVDSAVRRSYPISENFPSKFFDLDRCFELLRLPVEGTDKQLVLINNHMSAYDEGGTMRKLQLEMISGVMADEAAAGNWVIVGGDWNHALCDSAELYPSNEMVPGWVAQLSGDEFPEGFSVVRASNLEEVATCRNNATPYVKGETYRVTVDGFVVSSNVEATCVNIENDYSYSDHQPVQLTFKLKG